MQFSSILSSSAVLALATASSSLTTRALQGQATFYGGNVAGGTCSFSTYTLPAGILGTALSDSNWDNAANCGACVSVQGPSGSVITAMIVDQCPGCGENHLDLFPNAFSDLADPTIGVIDVTWNYIDCPITTPLELHNKDGVSANWFSMQVVNSAKAVSTLEVSTDGGKTWLPTTRQTYNFFENASGFGTATVDVKVTSADGDVVIVNDVPVTSDSSVTASSNFVGSSAPATSPSASTSSATALPTTAAPEPSIVASSAEAVVVASSSSADSSTTTTYSTTTTTRTKTNYKTSSSTSTTLTTSSPSPTPTSSTSAALGANFQQVTSSYANSTSAVQEMTSAAGLFSTKTISTCVPTVLYSTITVTPVATGNAAYVSYANNVTIPLATATATPSQFTGAAPVLKASTISGVLAGLVAMALL